MSTAADAGPSDLGATEVRASRRVDGDETIETQMVGPVRTRPTPT